MTDHRAGRVLCAVFFFILSLSGCSQVARDKLLRTFIDGVPEKGDKKISTPAKSGQEKKTSDSKEKKEEPVKPSLVYHPPFIEQMCNSCHDSGFSQKLILKGKELCFSCHDDFAKGKKVIHYPVSEDMCLECHDPHQSENKFLLKKKVPGLCFTCHEDFTKDKKVVHYPASEGLCLECHDPHSSDNPRMLKKAVPDICFTCHDEKEIKGQPQHEGQNACLECHEAHASNEEKLLK